MIEWYNEFMMLKSLGNLTLADLDTMLKQEPYKYAFFQGLRDGYQYLEEKTMKERQKALQEQIARSTRRH